MQKIIVVIFFLFYTLLPSLGQVLDDSTKLVYSHKTTNHYTFDDIYTNSGKKYTVDTSILNIHTYNYFFKNGILYQDLGNIGTPLHRIYYEPPTSVGKRLGFSSLSEYGYQIDKINFYDTKSPYTKLHYIQGSRGQQSMEVEHTRNIRPNWNAGFSFKRMVSLKQLGVSQRLEQQSSHYSFAAHTSYFSKNKRYTFLFGFTFLEQSQYENGGILVDTTETKADMFDYKLERVQLYSLPASRTNKIKMRGYDRRSNFRFYNQYAISKNNALQLFHQFDYHTNYIRFDDGYLTRNKNYYPDIFYDSSRTRDRIFHELYENKVGIKGGTKKIFYLAYLRRKDFSFIQTNHTNLSKRYAENIVGGRVDIRLTDSLSLVTYAEHYLGHDVLLSSKLSSRYFQLSYYTISYSPTLYQLHNESNHYRWNNDFANTFSNTLSAQAFLNTKFLQFSPNVELSTVQNMIYFSENVNPLQSNKSIQMASVGGKIALRWRALNIENYLRYTNLSGADVWRAPAIFNNGKVYLYGMLFKKALRIQTGIDLFWKSSYYGNAYAPGAQQFYLSDKTNEFNKLDGYMLADVFLNVQIKRAFIFLKFSHANMGLTGPGGYFITPYYTGMPRSFDFGIRWLFYD